MYLPIANMQCLAFIKRLTLLVFLLWPSNVHATYWTVTSYFQIVATSRYLGEYTDDDFLYTYTTTQTVKSGVSPTARAISTSRSTRTYDDLTIVYVYLQEGSVRQSDIITSEDYNYDYTGYTVYIQPITYTAPASCPTAFTVEATTSVDVPTEVADQVTPTSWSTSIDTGTYYSSGLTRVTAYLSANAVPIPTDFTRSDFTYSYYIRSCRNPTATGDAYWGPGGYSGYSGGDDDDDDDYYNGSSSGYQVCSLLTGCTTLRVWVIVVATLLPSLFVLGFVESFIWFRRLMIGKSAMRLGTVSWILISLWILCFTAMADERSKDDQARLRAQWDAMSVGTRWKLWWRWGFRRKYPVEILGDPKAYVPQVPPQTMGQVPLGPQGPISPPPIYSSPMQQQYSIPMQQQYSSPMQQQYVGPVVNQNLPPQEKE